MFFVIVCRFRVWVSLWMVVMMVCVVGLVWGWLRLVMKVWLILSWFSGRWCR